MIIVNKNVMAIDGKLLDLMIEFTYIHAELMHREPEMALAVEAYLADLTEEIHRTRTINRKQMVEMYEALTHSGILEDLKKGWNNDEA